ncbi:hypothetical protein LXA43DRAFT_18532 [Ganoderma leucocontextum]|nr:hypothetical protein LXA43DRAFT_18532 [Ganoderma leucocontextum]
MSLPPFILDQTLGAAFIGNILAACLYGLTTLQTYIYFARDNMDSCTLNTLIAILWVLDTLHLVLISHTVYVITVSNFGNILASLKPTWSLLAHVIVTGISDGIVRGIFCHRIWILSDRNRWLCAAITFPSLVAFGQSSGLLIYPGGD